MVLPLDKSLKIGVQTIHREPDDQSGLWLPTIDELVEFVQFVDKSGFDSLWVGDHLSMPLPFFDPFQQLAQAAVASRRLLLGTGVYLLPLRHPGPVAKQVATLDHLSEGRLLFGVGIGGEFPKEYEVAGIPINERGARLTESIEVMRALWRGDSVSYKGKFFKFSEVLMTPPPRQKGGPPIWCGGRKDPAFKRMGRLADGYVSYVVTPEMYSDALIKIEDAANNIDRNITNFGTGHLIFTRVDDDYETALEVATASLSKRYAMDFRRAAERYAALGTAEDVASKINEFHAVGVRHIIIDLVGPYENRLQQIERFSSEVLPLLSNLR